MVEAQIRLACALKAYAAAMEFHPNEKSELDDAIDGYVALLEEAMNCWGVALD